MSRGREALSWQVCEQCGDRLSELESRVRCDCGGLLELEHAPPSESGQALRRLFEIRSAARLGPDTSGVWRYRELVLPGLGEGFVSHPEGNTPLMSRPRLSAWAGAALWLKHEGHNPTGSFKDRGMTVGISQAKRLHARAVACASTGNTAASLAAYAAQAGLPALVVVPVGRVALGKLAQTLAYGARTLLVRGDFDDCLRLMQQASDRLGVYLLNSVNPFRIEGQKTIVFDLLQQFGWDPPDWIVVPAGNLGNTAAFGKALREAKELGIISRAPRIAAVQAAGAAPFAMAFREGFARRHTVRAETIASAIRIGDPASWNRAVRAIRETDGIVTTVTDEEILAAKATVDGMGVGCEPASAAAVAGVRNMARDGIIAPGARVVAILTGHLLKDPEILTAEPEAAGPQRPMEIEANLDALEGALDGAW